MNCSRMRHGRKLRGVFSRFTGDFISWFVLHFPPARRAMETAASLPPDAFRTLAREKLEAFSDEDLESTLEKLNAPGTRVEGEMEKYLANLGILEEVKQLIEQEVFLREHRKKYHGDSS